MDQSLDLADLAKLKEAFKQAFADGEPPLKTTEQLQEFVDDKLGIVSKLVSSAAEDKPLTQIMLENAGVQIRSQCDDYSPVQMQLQMVGMWDSKLDLEQYADTQNSYIGSKFIEW